MKVLFAGSFNPFTIGHYSIFTRACKLFGDKNVFIGVAPNVEKNSCSLERLRWTINPLSENVVVIPEKVLTADFCAENGISYLVRSMRNATDFDYEMKLAAWNREFGIETVFIPGEKSYENISSLSVRTLTQFGKSIAKYLPELVCNRWISKPKRIIATGFIGAGKSSYINAFFRGKHNCIDMDEVAKKCLSVDMRNSIKSQITSSKLDSACFNAAGQILYDEILKMPKNSIIEASALGTYARYNAAIRKLYDDSVIIHVDKFHSDKDREIDEGFMKSVLAIQERPSVVDFTIDTRSQSIMEIEGINAKALSLLQSET
ncbi:MAG: pantetheine-phosphate adenylyltransferase [Holosporales bacterium]|jgi:pantetheine-phosphate adenylyltransferase|nr:pantetheine-phosphate adenylyltransferase [Holosporales bacterium]